jgi:hypothetical protein
MSQLSFRVARGLTVVVAIIVAHFVIAWLFQHMRVPAPDLGPFFPSFLDDPRKAPETQPPAGNDAAKPASAAASDTSDVAIITPPAEPSPTNTSQAP